MTSSFYIRPTKALSSGKIHVRISEGRGRQYRFSAGYEVKHLSHWNENTQLVRTVASESHDIINHQLKRLKAHIETRFYEAKASGQRRDKAFYEAVMDSFSILEGDAPKGPENTIEGAFEEYIRLAREGSPRVLLKPRTINTYVASINHIRFLKMEKTLLSDLDMEWYYEFVDRSEAGEGHKKPHSMNYIAKMIKKLKRVLRFAEDGGAQVHPAYKSTSFKAQEETADEVYLDLDELLRIQAVSIPESNEAMQVSRDLFLIGCYTGLRVSDYRRLSKEHMIDMDGRFYFEITSEKTGKEVTIPIHPVVLQIMSNRDGELPPQQPAQCINRNIKLMGAMAGVDQNVTLQKTSGGRKVKQTRPKYELIKTHTGRRSFCTNAYLMKMDCLDIMAVSGHTSEVNFLKYIKVTRHERAKRIAEHAFFQ